MTKKENHTDTEKENSHLECGCTFPQIHQNRLGDKEFFPKLRTIKLKKTSDHLPCEYRYDSTNIDSFEKYLNVTRTPTLIIIIVGAASLIFCSLLKPAYN